MTAEITILNTREEDAEALASLQSACFPGLPAEDYFTAEHYRSHVRVFPDGQFVALTSDGQAVGATSSMRTQFDPVPEHYIPFIGHNWLTTHNPEGMWLYGIDMSVHPDWRRLGIARRFYTERATLVQRLGLRGELVAGLLPGYDQHRHLSVEAYAEQVVAGNLVDPTLTPQLRIGLRFVRLLPGYVTDSRSDNVATLLERPNPHFAIYHLIRRDDWAHWQGEASYAAPSLASEGFIHFSMRWQVPLSANRYYAGRTDMLLLVIDPTRVTAPLVYEAPINNARRSHERFPHLYSELNLDAVIAVTPYLPGMDGTFTPPA
jgi:uncharacterized protein (DUF952 family)/GNAT superfamily N-acetyltransferase